MTPRDARLRPEEVRPAEAGDGAPADPEAGLRRTLGAAPPGPAAAASGARDHGEVAAGAARQLREACDGFQSDLAAELTAMARHVSSSGGTIDPAAARLLRRAQAGEDLGIDELIHVHRLLAAQVAPATPRAIRSLDEDQRIGGLRNMLGPTPPVRRLSLAVLFFALMFFGLSISPRINEETIALSLYEQSGANLVVKLLFILSAAGLGAGFGALFEIWQDIHEGRFDPIEESTHWMRIGLGIVAGLVLSEIVGPRSVSADASAIAEPLIALVGGFSARIVHLVVTRLVSAIEHTFEAGAKHGVTAVPPPVAAREPAADAGAAPPEAEPPDRPRRGREG